MEEEEVKEGNPGFQIKVLVAHYASKLEGIPIEQVAWDWAIEKLHSREHHYWTSWQAFDKGRVLQPFPAYNRLSENS